MNAQDDGAGPKVKTRSVPSVSTERLKRSMSFYHGMVHTQEGLHSWDDPRRGLIDNGMRLKVIAHELRLRGEEPGDCKFCWGEK